MALQITAVMAGMGLILVAIVCAGFYWGNYRVQKANALQLAELLVGTLVIAAQINGDDANLIRITTAVGANPNVVFLALVEPQSNFVLASTQNQLIHHPAQDSRIRKTEKFEQKLVLQAIEGNNFYFYQPVQVFSPSLQKVRKLNLHLILDGENASNVFSSMLSMLLLALICTLTLFAVLIFYFLRNSLFQRLLILRQTMRGYMRQQSGEIPMPEALNELQQLEWTFTHLTLARNAFEQQLTIERDKAEAANRAKNIFISNMSHQLRTPLNSIIGFSQHLVRAHRGKDERLEKSLQSIFHSGNSLLKFVNYILDFAKIDAGELRLEFMPVNAMDICRAVMSRIEKAAEEKGLLLVLECDSAVQLNADTKRLQDVLDNLLQNSLAYTAVGFICLSVEVCGDDLVFCVRDTGRGIRSDDLARIFNRFESLNENSDAQVGMGAGLGLAIAQDLVRLHGGSIEISSVWGEGTCAQVRIPIGYCPLGKNLNT